jgi:hypothetical protein
MVLVMNMRLRNRSKHIALRLSFAQILYQLGQNKPVAVPSIHQHTGMEALKRKDFQVTLEPRTMERTVTDLVRWQIRGLESVGPPPRFRKDFLVVDY